MSTTPAPSVALRHLPEPEREPEPEATDTCPECGGDVREEATERVCPDCGLVVDTDPLAYGYRPRYFGDSNRGDPRRHGPPTDHARHDRGLGSQIGHRDGLPGRQRLLDRYVQAGSHTDRARRYVFGEIDRMSDRLDLPEVAEDTACRLFREAQDANLVLGRSMDVLAAAALAIAARVHGAAVPVDRVREVGRFDEQNGACGLWTAYKLLVDELGLPVPPPDPAALVGGLCRELGLKASTQTAAERLIREADGTALSGRHPMGVAAGAVWLATGRRVAPTQTTIADAADVTAPTVRAAARVLEGADGE